MKNAMHVICLLVMTLIFNHSYSITYNGDIYIYEQSQIDDFVTTYGAPLIVNGQVHVDGGGSNITNLDGLSGLVSITGFYGELLITETSITNIDGLSGLTQAEVINLWDNSLLTNLDGFSNLSQIGTGTSINAGSFTLLGSPLLENIDGLSSLTILDSYGSNPGSVGIEGSNELTNLDGLSNIPCNATTYISNCTALIDACAIACNLINGSPNSNTWISNNGPNTSSAANIVANCGGGEISGVAFHDANNNCMLDASDTRIANQAISISPSGQTVYTDDNGEYSVLVDQGTHTVTLLGATWTNNACTPSTNPVVVNAGGIEMVDFTLEPTGATPPCLPAVRISSFRRPCPGSDHTLVITLDNIGTQKITPGQMISVNLPDGTTDNHIITQVLNPGQSYSYTIVTFIDLFAPNPVSFAATTSMCGNTFVATRNDFSACAIDPNDMVVSPEGCGPNGNITQEELLTYRVRFENVGNGPATDVYITDLLSSDLDLSTLKLGYSTHPVTRFEVNGNNELEIDFEGINLAGTQFSPDNKGYVFFTIAPKVNLPEGTIITNEASIIFDQNAPIITNSVVNTVFTDPTADASFDFSRSCESLEMEYDFSYTGTSIGVTYSWDFGSSASPQFSTDENPTGIVFATVGDHLISLTIDKNSCLSTIEQKVTSIDATACGKNKVSVCMNGNTICVNLNALPSLLNNGACVGPCDENEKNSKVSSLKEIEFSAYPNPFNNMINVHFSLIDGESAELIITDASGVVIQSRSYENVDEVNDNIDFGQDKISSGIYFVTLRTTYSVETIRLIKAK